MAGRLIIEVAQPALDSNGNLINGSTLEFYDAVTFTPKAVFSSAALTTSLGSVVTASGGFFPEMWANDGESYRVIWKNASGAVLRTIDNIQAPVAGESKSLRASSWGAVPTATAVQNRNALQAAIDYCSSLGGGTIEIDIPGYYSIAKRTSVPTDRALNVPKGVNIRGLGTGAPQDSGVALVTLQPSEDMTLFIAGDTISTQTCTISNASPCVITANNHGKVAGDVVYFATSGSLPAPLLPMFPYYVLAAGLTADSFRIGLSGSTPAINTTTAGSGVHTLISASSLTHSFGMSNINIYGGAVANVQCLIAESTVGAEWDNVLVEPGDATKQRHGWLHAANFLAAWLNQYTRLQVGGFTAGVGAAHYGSDSSYSQCLFSGSGVNFRFSEGSITIDGGQCENGNNGGGIGTGRGMELVPSNTGRNVAISIRSRFVANNGDIYIYDSPTGSGFNGRVLIDSTHHDCRATNISIGVNFNNVTIDGTFNEQNPAGVPHVTWRGASTGCVVRGNFSEGVATRFSGLPADALVLSGGNGQLNKIDASPQYLEWYGGSADGVTDNAAAFTRLLSGLGSGVPLELGLKSGTYRFSTMPTISGRSVVIRGAGQQTSFVNVESGNGFSITLNGVNQYAFAADFTLTTPQVNAGVGLTVNYTVTGFAERSGMRFGTQNLQIKGQDETTQSWATCLDMVNINGSIHQSLWVQGRQVNGTAGNAQADNTSTQNLILIRGTEFPTDHRFESLTGYGALRVLDVSGAAEGVVIDNHTCVNVGWLARFKPDTGFGGRPHFVVSNGHCNSYLGVVEAEQVQQVWVTNNALYHNPGATSNWNAIQCTDVIEAQIKGNGFYRYVDNANVATSNAIVLQGSVSDYTNIATINIAENNFGGPYTRLDRGVQVINMPKDLRIDQTNRFNGNYRVADVVLPANAVVESIGPVCAVSLAGNQSIPNGTTTTISWTQEDSDGLDMRVSGTPTRITIPAGRNIRRVIVSAYIQFDASTNGERVVSINRNGNLVSQSAVDGTSVGQGVFVATVPLSVVPGDYFEVTAFQSSGGALNAQGFGLSRCVLEVM